MISFLKISLLLVVIEILILKTLGNIFGPIVTEGNATAPTQRTGATMEVEKEGRIIGGSPAKIKDYPYLVGVSMRGLHVCGGSYVKPYWVLTAAHCLKTRIFHPEFTAVMGKTYLYEKSEDVQVRDVRKVIPHPNYHPENDTNDIGVMNLEAPFELSPKVRMIKLNTRPYTNYRDLCKVAGWGVTDERHVDDRSKLAKRLLSVKLPIVPQERCLEIYNTDKFRHHFMGVQVFCAGYDQGGFDACQGDSGGPFVCNGIQVGIISWGIGCGKPLPGVYVNITTYLPWLNRHMKAPMVSTRRNDESTINNSNFLLVFCILQIPLIT